MTHTSAKSRSRCAAPRAARPAPARTTRRTAASSGHRVRSGDHRTRPAQVLGPARAVEQERERVVRARDDPDSRRCRRGPLPSTPPRRPGRDRGAQRSEPRPAARDGILVDGGAWSTSLEPLTSRWKRTRPTGRGDAERVDLENRVSPRPRTSDRSRAGTRRRGDCVRARTAPRRRGRPRPRRPSAGSRAAGEAPRGVGLADLEIERERERDRGRRCRPALRHVENGAAAWNARTASSSRSLTPDGVVMTILASAPFAETLTRTSVMRVLNPYT